MPFMYSNFGLDDLFENERVMSMFLQHLASEGKSISGYYESPNIFSKNGDIDFYFKTSKSDDKEMNLEGIDLHCSGRNVWEMINLDIDITPNDAFKTERTFMFANKETESGMIPINIINADVLPSFLEGDIVKMQMCALPYEINYYADIDEYSDAQPEDDNGEKWLVAEGSIIPLSFLINHDANQTKEEKDYSTDDFVIFTAKVKGLYRGIFEFNGVKTHTFIRCVAETMHGDIDFIHTYTQLDESMIKNIKVGSIISGYGILQGDVAIYEYENGIVKNFENNLKLMRHVFSKGEAERMRPLLTDDTVFITENAGKTFIGTDEIINRFNYVCENITSECIPLNATLIESECEMEYPMGTKCMALAYNEIDNIESIVFIDVDNTGNIRRIYITNDSRYRFEVDINTLN